MIHVNVPSTHPLTASKDATYGILVIDRDGPAGVYPSIERARAYVLEWLKQGDEEADRLPPAVDFQPKGRGRWDVVVGGEKLYDAFETYYRN